MKISGYNKCSFIDYEGHIASVVFTSSCNMTCPYCYNKELLDLETLREDDIFEHLLKRRGELTGVVICGGEPSMHADLPRFIRRIKELGFDVKLDTNGSNPEMLKKLIKEELIDYIAMDIKAIAEKYKDMTGLSFDKVSESIDIIRKFGKYEFRTTAFPSITHDDFRKLCEIHKDDNYFIQQYKEVNGIELKPYTKEFFDNLVEEYGVKLRGF